MKNTRQKFVRNLEPGGHPDTDIKRSEAAANRPRAARLPGAADRGGSEPACDPRTGDVAGTVGAARQKGARDGVLDACAFCVQPRRYIAIVFAKSARHSEGDAVLHDASRERTGVSAAESSRTLAPFVRAVSPLSDPRARSARNPGDRAEGGPNGLFHSLGAGFGRAGGRNRLRGLRRGFGGNRAIGLLCRNAPDNSKQQEKARKWRPSNAHSPKE